MGKPRILLIFTGGTIGMIKDPSTGALQPAKNVNELLKVMPELEDEIDLNFNTLMNIDSSNMTPDDWTKISKCVKDNYEKYDGFVVTHGTDTMAYTASALSFSLQNLSKPVVLTGSLIPLSELGADGRNNLIFACLTASMDIAEVCIVFANRIIRGNRAKKHHESFIDVFHSPNYPYLGELGRPTVLYDWRKKRLRRALKYHSEFDPKVSLLKLFPGFDPEIIDRVIDRGVHGIIIEGFGPGNIPFLENNSIVPQIKKATQHGIPVILATQMEKGITNLEAYECGYKAACAGAISSKDMTTEATLTKLMWALSRSKNVRQVKKIMESNLAGEINV